MNITKENDPGLRYRTFWAESDLTRSRIGRHTLGPARCLREASEGTASSQRGLGKMLLNRLQAQVRQNYQDPTEGHRARESWSPG